MKEYTDKKLITMPSLILSIDNEHFKQIEKWGIQKRTLFEWLTFLTEEVGELANAISEYEYREGTRQTIYKEAIQSAVLSLKIAEMIKLTDSEEKP